MRSDDDIVENEGEQIESEVIEGHDSKAQKGLK